MLQRILGIIVRGYFVAFTTLCTVLAFSRFFRDGEVPPSFAWPFSLGLGIIMVLVIMMMLFDPPAEWVRRSRLVSATLAVSFVLIGSGPVLLVDRVLLASEPYVNSADGFARWKEYRGVDFSYSRDYFGDGSAVRRVGRMNSNPIRVERTVYLVWPDGRIETCGVSISGKHCMATTQPEKWLGYAIGEGERRLKEAPTA